MKIICVGRNYAAHAQELKNEIPAEPVLFLKPETALIQKRMPFFYPDFSKDVHYEVELVIRINRLGKHIEEQFAHKYYNEITVGIDFTARDVQKVCKEKGLPWEKAKAFDGAAAVGKFMALNEVENRQHINFSLKLNGEVKQQSNSSLMLHSIDQLIAYISRYFTLKIGDLIFTGTPKGVGEVKVGDELTGAIEEKELLKVRVR
jgi:2-keto-4-pentenoate hydratase/2-oxohepta-3-ene-1,7-dioic acid hydratase in catechol pathway